MSANLLIEVRLHDGRYHGTGEAEPSPGRLFQALVAGAVRARLGFDWQGALRYLETCAPPVIALPHFEDGPTLKMFVPNNDLDRLDGDVRQLPKLRVGKDRELRTFDPSVPFLYAWTVDVAHAVLAQQVCAISEGLYQFGRGIDPAWARAEIVDDAALAERLRAYPRRVLYPGAMAGPDALRVPGPGTFDSLERRFTAFRSRLKDVVEGRRVKEELHQPPAAAFRSVSYGARARIRVYKLENDGSTGPVRLGARAAYELCVAVRDAAVERLTKALPDRASQIDAALVGRRKDGSNEAPAAQRVRIVPLPSIGHEEADRRIRRVAVMVPDSAALDEGDVFWAFSNLSVRFGSQALRLVDAWDDTMLGHYTNGGVPAARWRSVTPVALPEVAARRRIEPERLREEAKGGSERQREEEAAGAALLQALRHADINVSVLHLTVGRTSLDRRGERAELFAATERFKKERLWHVSFELARPVEGPLTIGDGRFLGLGLLAPLPAPGCYAFAIRDGLTDRASADEVARAFRRAVMARAQAVIGARRSLPSYFSGHGSDGEPARGHAHLRFVCDLERRRVLVMDDDRPSAEAERSWGLERHRDTLSRALAGLRELRAGRSGLLDVAPISVEPELDPLFGSGRVWASVTPFAVTRHAKRASAEESVRRSVLEECRRKGLPAPLVQVRRTQVIRGLGQAGEVTLTFPVSVGGPLLLGRTEHIGGGVFARLQ